MKFSSPLLVVATAAVFASCQAVQPHTSAEDLSISARPSAPLSPQTWGPGTMHVAAGGSFDSSEFESISPDVDVLTLNGEYGYLITDNVEINAEGRYSQMDFGGGLEPNSWAWTIGGRYYLTTPTAAAPTAVYAGGRVGIVGTETAIQERTDPAFGGDLGVIWWPWGVGQGMAVDVSVDYLASDELNRLALMLAMGFWW
ncbi:MAG TPA: hypothetical protein VGC54_05565 [Planctomycetota bacterium]